MHEAAWIDLDPATAYDVLRLRVDVFVVEQACAYPELDGRDVEPAARHFWISDGAGVAACLRVLPETDGARRIGRVCTRADARGRGFAVTLLDAAVRRYGARPLRLESQVAAVALYQRFGFRAAGREYVEDGIPHLPMVRRPG